MEITWEAIQAAVAQCENCPLHAGRTHAVMGEGDPEAKLLFVGEGPGRQEDLQGRPFVGPAGQLLDRMLGAIGLIREKVYIANIVKCRPPGNRVPTPQEAQACLPFLRAQVHLLHPRIIVALGATAARYTIDEKIRITRDRGNWIQRKNVWMMATYHPAALLRDVSKKREAWEDLQKIQAKLEEITREDE